MEILSRAFLRQELRHFKLKYAFSQVQKHTLGLGTGLSFQDNQLFGIAPSMSSIEIDNKEQYLKYM